MNRGFILLLAVAFLIGGAFYLMLKPQPPTVTPVAPTPPIAVQPTAPAPKPKQPATPAAPKSQLLILAASWQPAFCETASSKPECESQSQKRFDSTHFSLHGLWPRDEYCGVSKPRQDADKTSRWTQLPPVELAPEIRTALEQMMPGSRSQLERHEWLKHGTCYGAEPDAYFSTAMLLLSALNGSAVRDLFADNIGRELSLARVRDAFDSAFGPGAGSRVRMACADDGRRHLITELTVGLYGVPGDTPNLGKLILAANPTNGGCEAGIVDAAGLQ